MEIQTSQLQSTESSPQKKILTSETISVPGKVFLMGEYAALMGAPVLLATLSPRFELRKSEELLQVHPESPAGKWLAQASPENLKGRLVDPYLGQGGFGASTAQFALLSYRDGLRDSIQVWEKYRGFSKGLGLHQPSGADLLVQWMGGTVVWDRENMRLKSVSIPPQFRFLLFSASHLPGRKIQTHTHLELLAQKNFSKLAEFSRLAIDAFEAGSLRDFAISMHDFVSELARLGLESDGAREDRLALERVGGVLSVKGCGAGLSDAVLVLLSQGADSNTVIRAAESRGLRFVSDRLGMEPGIGFESERGRLT